jgi:serine phosphatase RsbU (regulator of sigma subunit)
MKLRTQLALAFLFLAVLPLGAIVFYSYQSWLMGDLSHPIESGGESLARIRPNIRMDALMSRIFALRRAQGEVLFALDAAGRTVAMTPGGERRLAKVPISCDPHPGHSHSPSWVVVTKKDPESGLCFGVARPIRESLVDMRSAAVRNFAYGLGLVGLCFAGVFPLSGRITRNLSRLMEGVERLGRGDLAARVPVRSRDEVGRLGDAFNRMAAELHENQARLLEEERLRKEREIERRLLEAENARKSGELEQARQFQLSLLPRELPRRAGLDLAVHIRTATEVGGDYYDFLEGGDGSLTIAIGDATGHGAAAGTMVTVAKGLFTARAGDLPPAAFLTHANEVIRRMQLGRMAMALTIVRLEGRRLTVSAAGMPPLLIRRARGGGEVEEVCLNATPLGALAEPAYAERTADLEAGDTLLLTTDGFPELLGAGGDPLGYPRAAEHFAAAAGQDPGSVIASLVAAGDSWRAGAPLHDDVTFVVVRVRA